MNSRKSRGLLVSAIAGAMTMIAMHSAAQAPAGGPPRGAANMGGPEGGPASIQRLGLSDPALELTAAQKARIDSAVNAYVAEQNALARERAAAPDARPSQEAMNAQRMARDKLAAAIGEVLDSRQRQLWQAAQAARQPRMDTDNPRARPGGNR